MSEHTTVHAEEPKSRGKQWLFGIGISKYTELPNLTNAVKDVKDIIKVLIEDYGLSSSTTVTLFDELANRENIIYQLDQLAEMVGKDDSLLIYFAGHGYLNKITDMGYWIPHDAKRGKTSLYIGNSTIRDYIKAIKSKHTLLIADSCFSGSFFVRGASRSSVALKELESIPSRWAICSGRHDEEVCDGAPGGNSPFAQSIIDALGGNTNILLNVAKLADRVVEQTRSNYEQLPEGNPIQGVGHKGGQYIFHRKAREQKFWDECQRVNTVRFYSQYLRQFRNGKYRSVALVRIKELEDEAAWNLAEKSNTIFGFYNYIGRDPDGKYIKEAEDRISILESTEESQSVSGPPSTERKELANIENLIERDQSTSSDIDTKKEANPKHETHHLEQEQNTEPMDTIRTESDQFSGKGYFSEAHTQIFPNTGYEKSTSQKKTKPKKNSIEVHTFKRWLWVGIAIPTFYFTLNIWLLNIGFIPFDFRFGPYFPTVILALGLLTHQIHGIIFSIRCHHVKFKFGTYFAVLIPPLTYLAYLWLSFPTYRNLGRSIYFLVIPPFATFAIGYWFLLTKFLKWSSSKNL